MIVLPTHRLFRGVSRRTSEELIEALRGLFDLELAGEGVDQAPAVWEAIEAEGEQGTIGLYSAVDRRWILARLSQAGSDRMREISPDHSSDWCRLGVSILERLVLHDRLQETDLPKPEYVHLVDELVGLLDGEGHEAFPMAALVMPATLDHIRSISEHAERDACQEYLFLPKTTERNS